MKICKELNYFKIIEILVIFIVAIMLHFTFEFSGRNIFVALFSATNESIWEHIKIVVMSTYIVTLVSLSLFEKREYNLWTALFFEVLSQILALTILLYFYKKIFLVENLIIVSIVLVISLIISKIVECYIEQKFKTSAKLDEIFKYLNIGVILLFMLFTFYTPNLSIFKMKI